MARDGSATTDLNPDENLLNVLEHPLHGDHTLPSFIHTESGGTLNETLDGNKSSDIAEVYELRKLCLLINA